MQGNKDKAAICNAGCNNTYNGRLSGDYYSQQICGPGSGSNEDTVILGRAALSSGLVRWCSMPTYVVLAS